MHINLIDDHIRSNSTYIASTAMYSIVTGKDYQSTIADAAENFGQQMVII